MGERAHEAGLLDGRQELAGCEQSALGVLPAHERLDPQHSPAAQVGLGLEVHLELALALEDDAEGER